MKVGEIKITKQIAKWQECQECGLPASFCVTYLLSNCRENPASSAYRHDDCSWCSDAKAYACKKHLRQIEYDAPSDMHHCASFALKKFKHMGFYWATSPS